MSLLKWRSAFFGVCGLCDAEFWICQNNTHYLEGLSLKAASAIFNFHFFWTRAVTPLDLVFVNRANGHSHFVNRANGHSHWIQLPGVFFPHVGQLILSGECTDIVICVSSLT